MARFKIKKIIRCAICDEVIDSYACNQNFMIIMLVKDTDRHKTRKIRSYLCNYHTSKQEAWLTAEAHKHYRNLIQNSAVKEE